MLIRGRPSTLIIFFVILCIVQGEDFGFESLEAHGRFMKASRLPPLRMIFAAVTWGKWEQWKVGVLRGHCPVEIWI